MSDVPSTIPIYEESEYVYQKRIENGSYGSVSLMTHPLFVLPVAVKFFSDRSINYAAKQCRLREIENMMHHNNYPNIVRFLSFVSNKKKIVGYSMEYMEGGSLHEVIHGNIDYNISDVVNWASQAVQALAWFHSQQLLHRDVKPGNMLLSKRRTTLKLCDFGTARTETNGDKTLGVGTLRYIAPELLLFREEGRYSSKCDTYSMGIVIWEMCTREIPFGENLNGMNDHQFSVHIVNGGKPLTNLIKDDSMRGLVIRCIATEPDNRPTMPDLNLHLKSIDNNSRLIAAENPKNIPQTKKGNNKEHPRISRENLNEELSEFAMETLQCFDMAEMNMLSSIGSGSQGAVFVCSVPYFGNVAVKRLTAHKMSEGQIREIETLRKLSFHPNIVQLYAFVKSEGMHIGYAMEYMSGGALSAVIHSDAEYNENHYLSWATQACRAIAYLHQSGFLHRDIKPQNMLLDADRKELKIADFGMARYAATEMTAGVGTAYYKAPEFFAGENDSIYDARCDVYSMAISLWEMARRRFPYVYKNPAALQRAVLEGTRPSVEPGNHNIPTDVLEIITSHWVGIMDRPSMHNMLMKLEKACEQRKVIIGKR